MAFAPPATYWLLAAHGCRSSCAVACETAASGALLQAMDNLKAHTMSYAPSKGAYESYFRRIESRYSNVYFAPAAEEKTMLPEGLLATSVIFAPLLAAAYVVLRK